LDIHQPLLDSIVEDFRAGKKNKLILANRAIARIEKADASELIPWGRGKANGPMTSWNNSPLSSRLAVPRFEPLLNSSAASAYVEIKRVLLARRSTRYV
jgi:hypothetical protein